MVQNYEKYPLSHGKTSLFKLFFSFQCIFFVFLFAE